MKKILFATVLGLVLASCGDSKTGDDLLPENGGQSADSLSNVDSSAMNNNLICLWEKNSFVDAPGKSGKWLKTLSFGRDLKYISDTTIDNKKYYKAKIAEGTEGWISAYNVIENAQVWVVTIPASVYKAPDPLTITESTLGEADLIVIKNEKVGSFNQFYTKDKKLSGYIKGENSIANDPNALEAALVYKQILAKTDLKAREEAMIQFQAHEIYGTTSFAKTAKAYLEKLKSDSTVENTIEAKILEANKK